MAAGIIRHCFDTESGGHPACVLPMFCLSASNQGQDLLGKGDDDTTGQGQKAIGTLRGIVGLEGKAHLHDAPAQQDEAHSTNQAENKFAEVIHHSQRIICSKGC